MIFSGWNLYDVIVVFGTLATSIPLLLDTPSQVLIQLQKLFLVSIAFKLVQKNDALVSPQFGSLPDLNLPQR